MIAFDNGPANGDYVRYIDDLMARAAVAASAASAASAGTLNRDDELGGGGVGRTRERLAAMAASQTASQAARHADREGSSVDGRAPQRALNDSVQTTGFVAPAAATPRSTAAAAVASALMSGQVGARAALSMQARIALGAFGIGALLLLAGVLWQPFSLPIVVGGGALIAWAVRTLKDARDKASGRASTA